MLCHVTPIMLTCLLKHSVIELKKIYPTCVYTSYIDLSIHDCFVYISLFFALFIILPTIYVDLINII